MPIKAVTFGEKDLKRIFRTDTPFVLFWRRSKRIVQSIIYFVILFAVFFLAINSSAFLKRAQFAAKNVATVTIPPPPAPKVSYPPEIIIPRLGLEAPVIYDATYSTLLDRLRDGVVRYEGTADPGQVGNEVLLGHSSDFPWSTGHYKTILATLDRIEAGDQIILPFGTERYTYTVATKKVVKASDLAILNRSTSPQLTLITCYPVGTASKRLVIVANLTGGPTGTVQTTIPFVGTKIITAR